MRSAALASLILVGGCGPTEGDMGTVTLTFEEGSSLHLEATEPHSLFHLNRTQLNLLDSVDYVSPSVFEMRIIELQMMTHADGPGDNGENVTIWAGKACSPEKGKVEKDDKEYDWYQGGNCSASTGNDYIDFTAGADEVNSIFNSQKWQVVPGSFNHISFDTCKPADWSGGSQDEPTTRVKTVRYRAEGMDEAEEFTLCSAWGTDTEGTISIGEGDQVTVNFTYDPERLVMRYNFNEPVASDANGCVASSDKRTQWCPNLQADHGIFTIRLGT